MIHELPALHPDELLWSVLARAGRRLRLSDHAVILSETFWGSRNATASIDLPSGLETLCADLGPAHAGLDADILIADHTLFPIYAPFLWLDRLEAVKTSMRSAERGGAIHMQMGVMASRVRQPRELRSCPVCDAEDEGQYGEPYWHRCHQVPGVEVCPEHKVFLVSTTVPRDDRRSRHGYVPAEPFCGPREIRRVEAGNFTHEVLIHVARDVRWLLQNRAWAQAEALRRAYLEDLAERGLATFTGRVRLEMLQDEFRARYPLLLLDRIQCNPKGNGDFLWLTRLLRSRRAAAAPIYHLLLIHFLGHTASSYFARINEPGIFGVPNWPCLNPVCDMQGQLVISTHEIERDERTRPVGTFKCPHCGYTYARIGPDRLNQKAERVGWVKDYGEKWKKALANYWVDPSVSLRTMAVRLGVDPLTVKRVAAKVGLVFPRQGKRTVNAETRHAVSERIGTTGFPQQRAIWSALAKLHPSAAKTELRRLSPGLYAWLYRNDRDWLSENSPRPLPNRGSGNGTADWSSRDATFSVQVVAVAEQMRRNPGRPMRISSSALARRLGISALVHKHSEKMRLTCAALRTASESREQFAARRVRFIASQKVWQEKPTLWRLIRLAGLRPELVNAPCVRHALKLALSLPGGHLVSMNLRKITA